MAVEELVGQVEEVGQTFLDEIRDARSQGDRPLAKRLIREYKKYLAEAQGSLIVHSRMAEYSKKHSSAEKMMAYAETLRGYSHQLKRCR